MTGLQTTAGSYHCRFMPGSPNSGAARRPETGQLWRLDKTLERLQVGEECNTATQTKELKSFRTFCRIPVSTFVVIVKAGQLARLMTILGDGMPRYLFAIHLPDNCDPSVETEATIEGARKGAKARLAPVEVREIFFKPAPAEN